MIKPLAIVTTAMLSALISDLLHNQAKAEPKSAIPPELQVLEARIGIWDSETTTKPSAQVPNGSKTHGVETNEWILGGRFQQTSNKNRPDSFDNSLLVTYDSPKKAFRVWFFDDLGNNVVGTGKWDEKKKTLTWDERTDEAGQRTTGYWRFVDKDNYEWGSVTKDRAGTVMYDATCKLKRRQ